MNGKLHALLVAAAALALAGRSFAQTATAQPPLTIDKAIGMAMTNQPLIDRAEADLKAARSRVAEARSSYYPNVGSAATWQHLLPKQQETVGSTTIDLAPTDYWDLHVDLNEIIYDFGKREFQVRLARSEEDGARISIEKIKSDIAFQTATSFYTVLFLTQEVADLDEQVANLEQHLTEAKAREETGSATHYDVLTTEVNVASVRSQRIDAANELDQQKSLLAQLTGLGSAEEVAIAGDFVSGSIESDARVLVERAFADRSELHEAFQAEKTADLSRSLASLGNQPSLSASAAMGFEDGLITLDNTDLYRPLFNWSVGLTLDMPIFDGFLTSSRTSEAADRLVSAKSNSDALRRSIRTEVVQALRGISAAHEQAQNSLAQLAQAREALDIAKTQYEVGAITNLQYLDSQTSLELAKLANLAAIYREVLSQLQLREAVGDRIWETKQKR